MFRTDKATLLLPIWYEDDAQFVPGQLAAPGATIDVASVPETAFAYEVTTTRITPLSSEPIPGGRKVKLPAFDTTAAIIVTSDSSLIADLKRKMETLQAQSARNWIELAKAKLNRVQIADDELTKLGAGQPDAPQLLAQARANIQKAEGIFPGDAPTGRSRWHVKLASGSRRTLRMSCSFASDSTKQRDTAKRQCSGCVFCRRHIGRQRPIA